MSGGRKWLDSKNGTVEETRVQALVMKGGGAELESVGFGVFFPWLPLSQSSLLISLTLDSCIESGGDNTALNPSVF